MKSIIISCTLMLSANTFAAQVHCLSMSLFYKAQNDAAFNLITINTDSAKASVLSCKAETSIEDCARDGQPKELNIASLSEGNIAEIPFTQISAISSNKKQILTMSLQPNPPMPVPGSIYAIKYSDLRARLNVNEDVVCVPE